MKIRWFSFMIGLVASTALLCISTAGAKQPKDPPGGTPGVAAKLGTPGVIIHTRYAPDGVTVLSTTRVRASAVDSSASVAARLGKSAPEAEKSGAITQWDDAGRPGAAVAQAESNPQLASNSAERSTASSKRIGRAASSSGCDAVEVTRDITGDIFGDWIGTFHHRVYWCWNYPRITGVNVACWSTVDGGYVDDQGCDGWGGYYQWRGSGHGGHVSFRQGDWQNCIFYYGCFKNIYPWIEIWINGNGAWAQDQGG